MSEKIYALLLCLYPAHFRRMYGEEALQLVRDRMRDEQGVWAKARLWWDLVADFAKFAPREYGYIPVELARAAAGLRVGGVPSFWILEDEPMRVGTWVWASVLSLMLVGTSAVLMDHAGGHPLGSFARSGRDAAEQLRWVPKESGAGVPQGDSDVELVGSGVARSQTPGTPGSASDVVIAETKLDDAERRRVVDAVSTNLKQHYADAGAAQKMADSLRAHEQRGDYNGATQGPEFADLLTRQLREESHDADLGVVYSAEPLRARPTVPSAGAQEQYRQAMQEMNCTFARVEMLPHKIGYLKLNAFPDPAVCKTTAAAVMARLNGADAVIFDLRENEGGYPGMVSLLTGYLFAQPRHLYSPRGDGPENWTRPVAGSQLVDKPVYVLTSRATMSAAEQFSYNLKMMKRATLVGETTRGSAHAGVFHRIDDHFGMGIPEVKAKNPYGAGSWEGVGVAPDVKAPAWNALSVAQRLAEKKVGR
jgi:hypothetical protein